MVGNRHWTKSEDTYLITFSSLPHETLAKALNRTPMAVWHRKRRLGLLAPSNATQARRNEAEVLFNLMASPEQLAAYQPTDLPEYTPPPRRRKKRKRTRPVP